MAYSLGPPPLTAIGSPNLIQLRVVDSGTPSLGMTNAFTVAVLALPQIQNAVATSTNFVLQCTSIPGVKCRVQFKDHLAEALWTDIPPDVTAATTTATLPAPLGGDQRCYRVIVVGN